MRDLLSPAARKIATYFFLFLMLVYVYACRNYFLTRSPTSEEVPKLSEIGEIYKYFIVHHGEKTMALNQLYVDSLSLYGYVDTLTRPYYFTNGRPQHYDRTEKGILQEVHVYLRDDAAALQVGPASWPLESIKQLVIIDPDEGRTVASYVLGGLGILVGTLGLLLIIVALTKSSCPYVYVYDGTGYPFAGEIFGGAIMDNLERDDYLPLPQARPIDGEYRLRISNELKERQYTNLANLLAVNHPAGSEVLFDPNGTPRLIQSPQPPSQSITAAGENLQATLRAKDRNAYLFNETNPENNYIQLQFEKPEGVGQGKLLLRAKNTLWLDYLYGDFASQFGEYYDQWTRKQAQLPTEERIQQVIDAEFPLNVYLRNQREWQLVDRLMTVGPLADRDFVVPVDLNRVDSEHIELRIESGFMFWEVDYVAMDFTPDKPIEVHRIRPLRAPASDGRDYARALATQDNEYLPQLSVGSVAQLHFPTPPVRAGQQQSVFLHARGYYELMREYEGWPKFNELRKFKEPGYFSDYSKMRYRAVIGDQDKYLVERSADPFGE